MLRVVVSPVQHRKREPHASSTREARSVVPICRADRDDAEIARGLICDDHWAVAALYDRYGPLVRRVLIRALATDVDVDDVAQEVFLTVIRRARSLRDPNALRSFVVSVTIRLARNELRKRAIRRWIGLDDLVEPPVTPAADETARDSVRRVYTVLDRMPPSLRMLFVLRHVEGLELTELARATGCSLATVKRKLARANARFEAIAASDPALAERLRREG